MLGIVGGVASTLGALAGNNAEQKTEEKSNNLGQADFIRLLMTQMELQSPLNPYDSNQMLQQMTNLASLDSNNSLKTTLEDLSTNLISNHALQASNTIGKNAQVPSQVGILSSADGLKGSVFVDKPASELSLSIKDASGKVVKNMDLGSSAVGTLDFKWDGIGDDGQAVPPGQYQLAVTGLSNGEVTSFGTGVNDKIKSVTFSQQGSGLVLNLEHLGAVDFQKISSIS